MIEEKSLDTAMDIYSALITGQEVSRNNPETGELYNLYYSDPAVFDAVNRLLKKLNLDLYEYHDAIYLTAGEGNRVFGYSNEDMKKNLGLRLNKELYLSYFIMYQALLSFYKDSASYQVREYVRLSELITAVTESLSAITKDLSVYALDSVGEESFKTIALLWDELPLSGGDEERREKASRASRTGYVRLAMNFMVREKLFAAAGDRYYPTDRMKALAENYFEEYKSRIYAALREDREDAQY